jgi:hypothetical protein
MDKSNGALARNVRRLGHLDLPGAGQVTVAGSHAYVGHIPNKQNLGTSIVDIADPSKPRVVATVTLDDPGSHSHKVRVAGALMVVNHERNPTPVGRRAEQMPGVRRELNAAFGREPTRAELAQKLNVSEADIVEIEAAEKQPYRNGGFRIYDVSSPAAPKLIHHQLTGGIGVHRFDMDDRYAYISTEMEGFVGNILVIYDLARPEKPQEIARWWMPGQHTAGGEKPTWSGYRNRLHHALRVGDQMWASCWHAGLRVIDVSDIRAPRTIGAYDYHPPFPEPTHTVLRVPFKLGGRDVAVVFDEEHDHVPGRLHAGMWLFDVSDLANIRPISIFNVSELASPWSRVGRFGAHQPAEHMKHGSLVFASWFSGGLRIVDIANPELPVEVGHYIPEPSAGQTSPQSNDVDVDDRGLVYLLDRNHGVDILEFRHPAAT